jgi:hypothetical protein
MHLSCARGSGAVPPTVSQIEWRRPGGVIQLADASSSTPETIACTTDLELQLRCRSLAEKRYLFVSDFRSWPSPADVMSTWQENGSIPISFLQVAWRGPGDWEVHEIIPGIQEWEIRPLSEILDNQPLQWTGPA